MTAAEALATMKRKCLVLAEVFTDPQLTGFLDDHRTGAGTDDDPYVYDVRRSIYDALTSAATVEHNSFSRGGVSISRTDFLRLRRQFATAGTISAVRTVEELSDDALPE
ncbi:hypothetical protein [Anaeroselena agilis]|uniref:Uncharacterized protein n=1 Tax=Anaeroselena agilis TaxID=3063788 RepID=A0ABU3NXM5_9FIRM|nr:hypothetical protein [Selenomonadales bacterium 4137-cl]